MIKNLRSLEALYFQNSSLKNKLGGEDKCFTLLNKESFCPPFLYYIFQGV